MPLTITHADITTLRVDAIVNAANVGLAMGGGVCGAIFTAAGPRQLQAACDRLAPINTGDAVITPGFGLPAKFVIHAAGPIYRDGKHGEEGLLRAAYTNSLKCAVENNCKSIAFPLISSGIYGYPKDEALSVATSAISGFLTGNDIDVSLVLFGNASFAISSGPAWPAPPRPGAWIRAPLPMWASQGCPRASARTARRRHWRKPRTA
ncbi:MAG: macro domain-containing protein [Clostridiales Family XIII bacterium]|nr:macro domain-containing protein [Clostridiales Family XIII bacterium]